MLTALLVTVDLGGNLPPMLGIGRVLAERGWKVLVHGDDAALRAAARAGLDGIPAAGFEYDPIAARGTAQTLRDIPKLWADRSRGKDAVDAARRVDAAVVVVDGSLIGALAECEQAGLRTVALAHTSWEGFRGFVTGPLGLLVRLRGAAALSVLTRADRLLVTSDPAIGRPGALPANATLTGPVLQDAPSTAVIRQTPLVVVSLSTVAFPGQGEALQRILDALSRLPVDVLASTGRTVDPHDLRPGANTTVHELIDHSAAMPGASAFVGHGGHAGTVRALAHGLPLLVIPMHPMMDQPRIGRAVAAAGAGLTLPRTASVDAIRDAVLRLLRDPGFATAATRIGRSFRDGGTVAADVIEQVAIGPTPALTPSGITSDPKDRGWSPRIRRRSHTS
ncbi:glycosyltransferase [uncultured Amnibacterium sp.]|uniref:glycosyltransferase n=1 Tax=uncultured Amnibacterium sp. TaxID=1631851 RepID=UPI0035CB556A